MNHRPPEELISAFLDGEVTADEKRHVEQLLVESAEHRQLFDELRALRTSLAALPRHRLNEDFGQRILRRAERALLDAPGDDTPAGKLAPSKPAALNSAPLEASPLATEATGHVTPSTLQPLGKPPRSWRAIVWPLLVVAAAIIVMVFNPESRRSREVAQAPPAGFQGEQPSASIGAAPEPDLEGRTAADDFAATRDSGTAGSGAKDRVAKDSAAGDQTLRNRADENGPAAVEEAEQFSNGRNGLPPSGQAASGTRAAPGRSFGQRQLAADSDSAGNDSAGNDSAGNDSAGSDSAGSDSAETGELPASGAQEAAAKRTAAHELDKSSRRKSAPEAEQNAVPLAGDEVPLQGTPLQRAAQTDAAPANNLAADGASVDGVPAGDRDPAARGATEFGAPAPQPVSPALVAGGGGGVLMRSQMAAPGLAVATPLAANTLVIECRLTPEAVAAGAFDQLLARHDLAESVPADGKITGGEAASSAAQGNGLAATLADGRAEPLKEVDALARRESSKVAANRAEALGLPGAEPMLVVVEATPAQLTAALVDLQSHPDQFATVELKSQAAADGARAERATPFDATPSGELQSQSKLAAKNQAATAAAAGAPSSEGSLPSAAAPAMTLSDTAADEAGKSSESLPAKGTSSKNESRDAAHEKKALAKQAVDKPAAADLADKLGDDQSAPGAAGPGTGGPAPGEPVAGGKSGPAGKKDVNRRPMAKALGKLKSNSSSAANSETEAKKKGEGAQPAAAPGNLPTAVPAGPPMPAISAPPAVPLPAGAPVASSPAVTAQGGRGRSGLTLEGQGQSMQLKLAPAADAPAPGLAGRAAGGMAAGVQRADRHQGDGEAAQAADAKVHVIFRLRLADPQPAVPAEKDAPAEEDAPAEKGAP